MIFLNIFDRENIYIFTIKIRHNKWYVFKHISLILTNSFSITSNTITNSLKFKLNIKASAVRNKLNDNFYPMSPKYVLRRCSNNYFGLKFKTLNIREAQKFNYFVKIS